MFGRPNTSRQKPQYRRSPASHITATATYVFHASRDIVTGLRKASSVTSSVCVWCVFVSGVSSRAMPWIMTIRPGAAGIAAEIQLALDRRLLQRVPEHLRPVLKTPHQHIPSEQRQQIPPLPKPEIILEMTARVISTASVHLIVVKCV